MRDELSLRLSWEHFISDGVIDASVNPIVAESWVRSRSFGVNPEQTVGCRCLSRDELATRVQLRVEFISLCLPLMNHLYEFVAGSGFMVTLCDQSGVLLKVMGDADILRNAQRIQFVEGANWSEEVMGTNAIGSAIALNQPLQIYAAEHYSFACQSWTCSASPIHHPSGEIIGVLNLSGPFEKVHAHTLGMAVSAAKAIENQLSLLEKNRKNEIVLRYLEATVNALTESMAIIDSMGQVLKVNQLFLHLVGMREEQVVGSSLSDLVQEQGTVGVLEQPAFRHRELSLRTHSTGRVLHVLADAHPIPNVDGESMGSLVMFREMKKVRQFVNHITDSQAKVTFADIIGDSRPFLESVREAKLAARTDATVLLLGESGTGKDLFAQAVHRESDRRNKPFIAINCGAIPRDLLGSELFGYVEGAFTGARKGGSAGKFELADGGTLFLDEIGEMSLEMQVLLLRVLQNREIVRIGGHEVVSVDVRIIAATNADLLGAVERGHFREDLYYRFNVMPIQVPRLRDRKTDIPLLTQYFVERFSRRFEKDITKVSPSVLQALTHAKWPGNIRELQNVLERAVLRSSGTELGLEHLPAELREVEISQPRVLRSLPLKEEIKKDALLHSIQQCRGNLKEAANYLGISRSTLYRQLERYGLR